METSPFKFGKVVQGAQFTNRQKEIARLRGNFSSGLNTILISPRRWGKTSLVKEAARRSILKNTKIKFCFLDMFAIRDENGFYKTLAEKILKSTSSKMQDWLSTSQKFLKQLSPKISMNIEGVDFGLEFRSDELQKHYGSLLDMAEKIALDKKIKIVICIDEFQNIGRFANSIEVQQRLRAAWQHHQNVSYCLYGSKRGMMMNLFEDETRPFYKFGEVIYLKKFNKAHITPFLIQRFKQTGKIISANYAGEICRLMDGHPYYMQQLAHLIWIGTEKEVSNTVMEEAVQDLISQNALFFEQMCDQLSNTQVNFLKGLASGVKGGFHNDDIRRKFRLGSSGNIVKIKNKLNEKEIINISSKDITFLDPAFELWFRKRFDLKK